MKLNRLVFVPRPVWLILELLQQFSVMLDIGFNSSLQSCFCSVTKLKLLVLQKNQSIQILGLNSSWSWGIESSLGIFSLTGQHNSNVRIVCFCVCVSFTPYLDITLIGNDPCLTECISGRFSTVPGPLLLVLERCAILIPTPHVTNMQFFHC